MFDALRRLGTSASDVLFSSGSIFVEGPDDVDILDAGFARILSRYKVTQLEGRGNVEREIQTLQEAEKRGEIETLKCFIFDLDNAPTHLVSSPLVRVSQWKRRCIENYLINEKVIYDLLRDDGISRDKIESRGEVAEIFRDIALSQLNDTIAQSVYGQIQFGALGLPPHKDLYGNTFAESAEFLFGRISKVQSQVKNLEPQAWCAEFERLCQEQLAALRPKWEREWISLSDGKRFFRDLQTRFGVKVAPIKLKIRIMERLERERADEWVLVESILRDALKL